MQEKSILYCVTRCHAPPNKDFLGTHYATGRHATSILVTHRLHKKGGRQGPRTCPPAKTLLTFSSIRLFPALLLDCLQPIYMSAVFLCRSSRAPSRALILPEKGAILLPPGATRLYFGLNQVISKLDHACTLRRYERERYPTWLMYLQYNHLVTPSLSRL